MAVWIWSALPARASLKSLPKPALTETGQAARQQVFHWIYHRGVTDFDAMTDIAKTMRPWLAERFVIGRPEIVVSQHSEDGTRKWLLRTADGHEFEMVFIPTPIAARFAFPRRWVARSIAGSVTRARCVWCAT
jgi:adenine C2-methylase RlmN of 23S rRNA A2503 and tRNA A37